MTKALPVVKWDKSSFNALEEAFEHIQKDSPGNAEKVRSEILGITKDLARNPEKYPPDKYKKKNPGNYRAFEKYGYRVAYLHNEREIVILRFRGIKQKPEIY